MLLRYSVASSSIVRHCLSPFFRALLRGNLKSQARLRRCAVPAEVCETRQMLSAIVVTSLFDDTDTNGLATLREAIQAANTDTSVDGSEAGSVVDVIPFDPSLGNLINLNIGQLQISGDLSIEGPGADQLEINGSAQGFRIFLFDDGNADRIFVTISGVSLTGAGDGTTNISGGAIINSENLTLKNVEFFQNDVGPDGHSGAIAHSDGNLIVSA